MTAASGTNELGREHRIGLRTLARLAGLNFEDSGGSGGAFLALFFGGSNFQLSAKSS
jgi:hypothetical protein